MINSSSSSSVRKRQQAAPAGIVAYETSPMTNTTFVQADPSNFRAVVQHLTGSPPLHQRRENAALLNINKLQMTNFLTHYGPSSSAGLGLVSPVSTLDELLSPTTAPTLKPLNLEERHMIAEKGFYLHPLIQTVSLTNAHHQPPQLLPLFPLHSSSTASQSHPPARPHS